MASLNENMGLVNRIHNSARNEKAYYVKQIFDKDSIYKKERSIADSIYQVKLQSIVDSSYAKSIKASNDALAKYNLILVDSMKRVAGGKFPLGQLSIIPNGLSSKAPIYLDTINGKKSLHIQFTSSLATSYNIAFKVYLVSPVYKNFVVHFVGTQTRKKVFIVPETTQNFEFFLSDNVRLPVDNFFITIIGNFSRDDSGNIIVPYNQTFLFNLKENRTTDMEPDFDQAGFKKFRERNNI